MYKQILLSTLFQPAPAFPPVQAWCRTPPPWTPARLQGMLYIDTLSQSNIPPLQGLVPDPTILDTSEVELVDVKFLEEEPVVVVQVGSRFFVLY